MKRAGNEDFANTSDKHGFVAWSVYQLLATSHKLYFVRTCQKRRENKAERTRERERERERENDVERERKKEEEAKEEKVERRGGKEMVKEVRWNVSERPKDSHRAVLLRLDKNHFLHLVPGTKVERMRSQNEH